MGRGFRFECEMLFARDHDPEQAVDQQAGDAARNEGNDHAEAEPEGADAEEFTEAAADAGNHAVPAGTT